MLNIIVCGESGLGKSTFIEAFLMKKTEKIETIKPRTTRFTTQKGIRKYKDFKVEL